MDFRANVNSLPLDRLAAPFEAASDALVRLGERLRSGPAARIADQEPGWALTARGAAALRGAQTSKDESFWKTTRIRSVEDDDPEGLGANRGGNDPGQTGEFDEIDALLARTSRVAKEIEVVSAKRDESWLVYDEDWNEDTRVEEWRERIADAETLPPLLTAGVALEAWETIEPLQRHAWLGPLLVADLLRCDHLGASHPRAGRKARPKRRDFCDAARLGA